MDILIVNERVPRGDRSGCDMRLLGLVRAIVSAGHRVTFISRFPAFDGVSLKNLQLLGVHVVTGQGHDLQEIYHYWFGAPRRFERLLAKKFDLAILSLWFWNYVTIPEDFLEVIRIISPSTTIAVLTDDRHAERQWSIAAYTGSIIDAQLARSYEQREKNIYQAADAVFTISTNEQTYVLRSAPATPVFVLPLGLPVASTTAGFDRRTGLVYLGDFGNEAVVCGANALTSSIFPQILKRQPDMTITLAGHGSEGFQKGHAQVVCLGYVPNLSSLFDRHRLFVSPLQFGTGIATKNILAMSYGLPVVTTAIGAQAIGRSHGAFVEADNTPYGFTDAVLSLYRDRDKWNALSAGGQDLVRQAFSEAFVEAALRDALEGLRPPGKNGVLAKSTTKQQSSQDSYPVRTGDGTLQYELGLRLLEQGSRWEAREQLRFALFRWSKSSQRQRDLLQCIIASLERCD